MNDMDARLNSTSVSYNKRVMVALVLVNNIICLQLRVA